MTKEAIILAGGLGTRLRPAVKDIPKPMADVLGKPFLHYLIIYLKRQGITQVVLAVGYKFEVIQNYFGQKYEGVNIQYAVEEERLGTGGAIKFALEKITGNNCFVLNGDTFFEVQLNQLVDESKPCVIASVELEKFDRYGTIEVDNNGLIQKFKEKAYCDKGLINGGIYFISKSLFNDINEKAFSFETAVLEPLSEQGKLTTVIFNGYFQDIGIPEDYEQFKQDVSTQSINP